ncbi:MAG TPA: enoyl-CoA hydratase/isomerase family protein [Sphingopyxis sp.]|nr:enoyl-CoA hydratase/isomerase family protein [Sphingopyxis sp.]
MTYDHIRYEKRGAVAVITYDKQERRNAWSPPLYRETERAIESANGDDEIGAIVLTHEGPIFCAGTDFKAGPEVDPDTGKKLNIAQICMMQDTGWIHLLARSKPMVGAVHGAAIGLGVTQLLPMDIRVGGESSTWSFPFLSLGFMPELGCTALLPRLVGYGRALDICLTSQKLGAAEAKEIGLISRVVPDEQVLDEAVAVAEKLAGVPKLQMRLTRGLFAANALEADTNAYLRRETDAFVEMLRAAKRAREAAAAKP